MNLYFFKYFNKLKILGIKFLIGIVNRNVTINYKYFKNRNKI